MTSRAACNENDCEMTDLATCSGCGRRLSANHTGPCPDCGDTRRTHHKDFTAKLNFYASLQLRRIREYYEKDPLLLVTVIIIAVGSPFLGLVLAGWAGVVAGLFVGLLGLILGFCAITKVREIEKRQL
jgi:hypothetical protein